MLFLRNFFNEEKKGKLLLEERVETLKKEKANMVDKIKSLKVSRKSKMPL